MTNIITNKQLKILRQRAKEMQLVRWTEQQSWPIGKRKCLKCNKMKNLEEFHKTRSGLQGRNPRCKKCRLLLSKKYYKSTTYEYRLFQACKGRAKQNKIPFNLELDDIIIPEFCPVLRIQIMYKTDYAPSIDRKDSSKGYTKGNIRVISKRANTLKNNGTIHEFELILKDLRKL